MIKSYDVHLYTCIGREISFICHKRGSYEYQKGESGDTFNVGIMCHVKLLSQLFVYAISNASPIIFQANISKGLKTFV